MGTHKSPKIIVKVVIGHFKRPKIAIYYRVDIKIAIHGAACKYVKLNMSKFK